MKLAPGTRTDEAASRVLKRLLKIAEVNLPGTLEDLDTEFLHDLRVSIRRARSVLRELKHVHDPVARQRLREELKWAQAAHRARCATSTSSCSSGTRSSRCCRPSARPSSSRCARCSPRRARELTKLRRGAAQQALRRGARGVARAGHRPGPDEAAGRRAPDRGGRRPTGSAGSTGAWSATAAAIDDDSPAEALHELRKRGKELRYLLELFGSPFPEDVVKPMVATLKDLQEVLGRFQDRAVQIELLREMRDELAAEPGGAARADGGGRRARRARSPTSRRPATSSPRSSRSSPASRSASSSATRSRRP